MAQAGRFQAQWNNSKVQAYTKFCKPESNTGIQRRPAIVGQVSRKLETLLWRSWRKKQIVQEVSGLYQCLKGKAGILDARQYSRKSCRPRVVAAAQRRRRRKDEVDNVVATVSEPSSPEPPQPPPSTSKSSAPEASAEPGPEALPTPSREQVLKACVVTSLGIGAAGLGLRTAFHVAAVAGLSVNDCSKLLPVSADLQDLLPTIAIVGAVSVARWLLLSTWPEFRESSEASNQQLLSSLELPDVFLLGLLPGLSEELLFRGFLVPAVSPDWKGAIVAGAVFGVLHITGGRNVAFGAWASAVGVVYGLGALYTQNLAVPVVAHAVSNTVVGIAWKLQHQQDSART